MNHVEATRAFLPYLEAWFGELMVRIHSGQPDRADGILMACPIWGNDYIARFQRYCLPTVMSEQNRAVLEDRCRMVLFTTRGSSAGISAIAKGLRAMRIDARVEIIPNEVMEHIPRQPMPGDGRNLNKYWVLGIVGNAGVQMAADADMGFHMLLPDHAYSELYFPNLDRLSKIHEGIAQTGISARLSVLDALEGYRAADETIAISGQMLGELGYRHLHRQTQASLMANTAPDDLPNSHLLTWQAEDKLVQHCPHMNAAWLSPRRCARAPTRIPATLDAELPSFMPADFHVPTVADQMAFIEISDDAKADNPKRVNFRDFAKHCWLKVRFQESWMPYFRTPCELPILPRNEFVPEEEISRQFNMLLDGMYELRAPLAYEFIESLAFQQ